MTDVDIANLSLSLIAGKPITAIDSTTVQGRAVLKWFAPTRDEILSAHPWDFATKRARSVATWNTTITGAANNGSGLIRITVSTAHGLTTGYRVHIKDVQGVGNANGTWYVTVVDSTHFDLIDSVFSGGYVSGGSWILAPLFGWDYQYTLPADFIRINKVNGLEGNQNDSTPHVIEQGILLCDDTEIDYTYVYQHTTYANWPQFFINAFAFLLASNVAQELTGPAGKALEMRKNYEQAISPQAMRRDSRQTKERRLLPLYDSQLVRSRWGFTTQPFLE